MSDLKPGVTRRHWLTGCARGAVLSGMGVAAGLLVLRGQVQVCALPAEHCPGCAAWSRCTLPAAALARRSQSEGNTGPERAVRSEVQA